MIKDLPYFKWFPGKYTTGDITLCSMETQGVFTNICNFYWMKHCSMSLANAKQRFNFALASLNDLLDNGIIKIDNDDNLIIEFLDEQMQEFIDVSGKRAVAGAKGGKANAKQMLSKTQAKSSNKDKDKDKDKKSINISEKQNIFKKECESFISDKYKLDMLTAFYSYWSEPNKTKTKMKCEMQETWDTKRRLITWYNRSNGKN